MRHNTASPLACCPRCHKAELAGRARKRPVFRYDKASDAEGSYQVFHGDHHVATVNRLRAAGPTAYKVLVQWDDPGDEELGAGSLRDARVVAEEAYIAVWREGRYTARGPVRDL